MTGSVLLDIGIGLMFVYLSLSLVVTAATELLNSFVGIRARNLRKGIRQLLGSKTMEKRFFAHPLVASIARRPSRLAALAPLRKPGPSYIPRTVFVAVLQDLLAASHPNLNTKDLAALVAALPQDNPIRRSIESLTSSAQAAVTDAANAAGTWFDNGMDRVSGDTKRFSQIIALIFGAVVAVGLDISTIDLVRTLADDEAQRTRLVGEAVATVAAAQPSSQDCVEARKAAADYAALSADRKPLRDVAISGECLATAARSALSTIPGAALGWQRDPFADGYTAARSLVGWLLTALALSLGAPFWFDLLSKVIRIRGAGVKPEKA